MKTSRKQTMVIEISYDTPEAAQFVAYLNEQGHAAMVGKSTGTYIDGYHIGDDDGSDEQAWANETAAELWEQYCGLPDVEVAK